MTGQKDFVRVARPDRPPAPAWDILGFATVLTGFWTIVNLTKFINAVLQNNVADGLFAMVAMIIMFVYTLIFYSHTKKQYRWKRDSDAIERATDDPRFD